MIFLGALFLCSSVFATQPTLSPLFRDFVHDAAFETATQNFVKKCQSAGIPSSNLTCNQFRSICSGFDCLLSPKEKDLNIYNFNDHAAHCYLESPVCIVAQRTASQFRFLLVDEGLNARMEAAAGSVLVFEEFTKSPKVDKSNAMVFEEFFKRPNMDKCKKILAKYEAFRAKSDSHSIIYRIFPRLDEAPRTFQVMMARKIFKDLKLVYFPDRTHPRNHWDAWTRVLTFFHKILFVMPDGQTLFGCLCVLPNASSVPVHLDVVFIEDRLEYIFICGKLNLTLQIMNDELGQDSYRFTLCIDSNTTSSVKVCLSSQ